MVPVVLEFYRKSSDREISVVLPRPVREQSPVEDAASEGSDRPAAGSAREGKLSRENSQGVEQDEAHESSRNRQDWREEERNNRMISQFSKEVEVVAFVNSGKQLGLVFDQVNEDCYVNMKILSLPRARSQRRLPSRPSIPRVQLLEPPAFTSAMSS